MYYLSWFLWVRDSEDTQLGSSDLGFMRLHLDVVWGFGHLTVWLELENTLPRWFTWLATLFRMLLSGLSFSPHGPSHVALCPQILVAGFPKSEQSRRTQVEPAVPFLSFPWRHVVSLLIFLVVQVSPDRVRGPHKINIYQDYYMLS